MKTKILIVIILTILVLDSFTLVAASEIDLNTTALKNGTNTTNRRLLKSAYGMKGRILSPAPTTISSTLESTTTPPPTTTTIPPTTTAPIITTPTTKPQTTPPPTTAPPSKSICGPTTILLLTLITAVGFNAIQGAKS